MKPWPTHPDGSRMTVGEMTPEQRQEVFREAGRQFEAQLAHPLMIEKYAAMARGEYVRH